ncbi:MAG TPA: prolyl oligopeptidase family serine peptidase [Phycisphaerae bacterium]|nr:prolyl oligopeptidase family serine peptidase [Phycisphaerae bacterium]HPS53303.1 prolyl oligopeptidase family serine peptidase [Phycisphaerae bacterium]
MKKRILLLLALPVIVCVAFAITMHHNAMAASDSQYIKTGYSTHKFAEVKSLKLNSNYLLFLPEDYGKPDKKFPVILFLHGSGERGCNPEKLKEFGPFTQAAKESSFPFIVIGPVCPAGRWWSDAEVSLSVMALLEKICKDYAVDRDRIYLTGLSMGGFGTWSLAEQYPNVFAAIAPVSGGGNPYRANEIKHIPTMIFHGKNDRNVPVWQAQQMAMSLTQAGGDAKLLIYPNIGHNIWGLVYSRPQLYSWFMEHTKSAPNTPATPAP